MQFLLGKFPLLLNRSTTNTQTERKRQRRGYLQPNRNATTCAVKQTSSLSVVSLNSVETSQDTSFREEDWWVDSPSSIENSASSNTEQDLPPPDTPIVFCNRGLELWAASREEWRKGRPVGTEPIVRAQPLKRRDREQVQDMLRTRMGPHPLPQVIALSAMIEMYNMIWNEDESEA